MSWLGSQQTIIVITSNIHVSRYVSIQTHVFCETALLYPLPKVACGSTQPLGYFHKKKKKEKEKPFDGSFSHCTACSLLNFLLVESFPAAKEAYDG